MQTEHSEELEKACLRETGDLRISRNELLASNPNLRPKSDSLETERERKGANSRAVDVPGSVNADSLEDVGAAKAKDLPDQNLKTRILNKLTRAKFSL